jgi:hypothetical protein
MKRIDRGSIDLLSYRDGGGCLAVFGMPFLLMGLGVMYLGAAGAMTTKGGQPAHPAIGLIVGGIFAFVGSIFVFGRSGTDFNRRDKTIRDWTGLLFPMFSKLHGFSEYNDVRITREVRKNKNSTYYVYQVSLTFSGSNPLKIHAHQETHDSRKLAEEIAKFVELPLVEIIDGVEHRREAGQLDESLRDQAARTGQLVELTAPPHTMRTRYEAEGNRVRFHIPPPPFNILYVAPVGCVSVVTGIFAFTFIAQIYNDPNLPAQEKLIYCSVIGIIFVVLPVVGTLSGALAQLKKSWVITAGPDELLVVTKGLLSSREISIPAKKIEELRVEVKARDCQIVAVSDDLRLVFAEGLRREEAEWIMQVIKRAVTT